MEINDELKLVSKVLVLDDNLENLGRIKNFCDQNGLIGLKVQPASLMTILSSNIDLGAIFLAEDYLGSFQKTVELAKNIRNIRPELPIALRVSNFQNVQNIQKNYSSLFSTIHASEDYAPLTAFINEYIFSLVYPNVLVRGISEIGLNALAGQFKHLTVSVEAPYIVRDRIIFGEVFSLIPLESSWCRGYMMLQAEEKAVLDVFLENTIEFDEAKTNFRMANNVLGEVTNLIWGAFKNRFIADDDPGCQSSSQVPLVINHQHKCISFGTENPQLCFKYQLADRNGNYLTSIYQWFIFNLNWSPENFKEINASVEELVSSGELELF